ncbi:dicarboxylate/amino acid:cation symporter [Priestia koreensis]|nr:dicarboxylate/amino acid:cation symporter [Priestia koreensis]UNL87291.1 dicarboxylate/amino acid:cation symporter [Priestia koreensis]
MKLSTKITLGLILGIIVGALLNGLLPDHVGFLDKYILTPIGQAFLHLIQFVVVPLVFTSLLIGFTGLRDSSKVGAYTTKLLLLYIVTSAVSLAIGLLTAFVLKPGQGVSGASGLEAPKAEKGQNLIDWLVSIIPTNPFQAFAEANLLQVIISAVLIIIGIRLVGEKAKPFIAFSESLHAILEKIIGVILRVAPIGVFALISSVIATQGFDLVKKLALYIIGLLVAILVMMLLYALIILFIKESPSRFFKSFWPAFSIAFGTASSNAALPVALDNAKQGYGLKSDVAGFAIPFGTALKRDGAGILQGFNAIFVAQLFHVELSPAVIGAIFISAILVSFSTAGVPGAGIIMMTTVLTAAHLPLEGIALVAGVDRITEGFRTMLNVVGNAANAVILNKWEKE